MTDPAAQLAFLRAQRAAATDPAARAMFDTLIASLEAQQPKYQWQDAPLPARSHSQQIGGYASIQAAIAGDVYGDIYLVGERTESTKVLLKGYLRWMASQCGQLPLRGVREQRTAADDDSLASTLAPLSSMFLCAPATNARAMLSSVQLVAETLDRRLRNTSSERWPLILAADEFTNLMRGELAEPLAALIERIAQEGRKVLVFALVSGQVWTAERTGGSALRDSLASCYVHCMKRRQANHLLQLGDELPEA